MIRIHFNKSFAAGCFEVYVFEEAERGIFPYKIEITRLPQTVEDYRIEPATTIKLFRIDEVIGAFLKGLEEAGLIPKMSATEAELKATLRHLSDLRALTFESIPAPPNPEF